MGAPEGEVTSSVASDASWRARLEARVARLEQLLAARGAPPGDVDDVVDSREAARILGRSYRGLRKLLARDVELCRCYWRPPGRRTKLAFSRTKLAAYKAKRS